MTRSIGLNQTTPPTGPTNTVGDIEYTEDGKRLMVVVKGLPPNPGFLAIWDVNTDGSLSTGSRSISGGNMPWSITNIPGKNAVLTADGGYGFDMFDLDAPAGASSGTPAAFTGYTLQGQLANCWSHYSKNTGNYYLVDFGSAINEVHIDDQLNATVVAQHPVRPLSATIEFDITDVAGKDYLYVIAANFTSIDAYSLDGPGKATFFQTLEVGSTIQSAGIEISPDYIAGVGIYNKHH
ncbi:hypothetical protein AX17_005073 [Amanita inopinata Kibby_2008]|nr:hypothetical protein AX17_005073 [Amanita inopinata Kibby_2008]